MVNKNELDPEVVIRANAKLAVQIARDAVSDYPRHFDRFISAIFTALQKASNG